MKSKPGNKPRWTEIFSPEDLPVLRKFYNDIFPDLIQNLPNLFRKKTVRENYIEANYPEWISLYRQSFPVLSRLMDLSTGTEKAVSEMNTSDIGPLFSEIIEVISGKKPESFDKTVEYAKYKQIHRVMEMFVAINHAIAALKYKKTIGQLMDEAYNNDEAILNLIKIDKAFLHYEPIEKRIRLAALSKEHKFFDVLRNALSTDYLGKIKEKDLENLMLIFFWQTELSKLPLKEFNNFLWELGIDRFDSERKLENRLFRLGLKKFIHTAKKSK